MGTATDPEAATIAADCEVSDFSEFPSWCREVNNGNWTLIYNEVLEYAGLLFSPTAVQILYFLLRWTGSGEWCARTHAEMGSSLCRSVGAINKAFKELIDAGAMERKRAGKLMMYRVLDSGVRGLGDMWRRRCAAKEAVQ